MKTAKRLDGIANKNCLKGYSYLWDLFYRNPLAYRDLVDWVQNGGYSRNLETSVPFSVRLAWELHLPVKFEEEIRYRYLTDEELYFLLMEAAQELRRTVSKVEYYPSVRSARALLRKCLPQMDAISAFRM